MATDDGLLFSLFHGEASREDGKRERGGKVAYVGVEGERRKRR